MVAGAAGAGVAVAIAARAVRARRRGPVGPGGERTYLRGVTVNRPPAEVYAFWRDLPRLATVLDRVSVVDEPERAIGWRSVDSPVPHEGRVEFRPAPGGRGTELRAGLSYRPPAGALGAAAARLTGDEPDLLLRDALRRVKQILECGEAIRVDGQPTGRGPVQERVTEAIRHTVATGGRP